MGTKYLTNNEIQNFWNHLDEEERSAATKEKYCRDIVSFQRFLSGEEVTKEKVVSYKRHLLELGYAERSVNSMLAAINSLFQFLGWYECRVKAIRLAPEIYRPEEKELTQKEYERLVQTATKQGKEQIAMILQTICGTGIRIGELQFITVEAVKRGEARVNCKGKIRKVFIVSELKVLLQTYIKKHQIHSGAVFITRTGHPVNRTSVWRSMKQLCKDAKVNPSKVFPHNLRHLFARVFYKMEKDIAKLADILGHSSINTTRIYIISTGKEHQKKMEKMGLICPLRM